jgi:hypothetical protein
MPQGDVCTSQGLTNCGGVCVDVQVEPRNCGACGVTCAVDENCSGGACVQPAAAAAPAAVSCGTQGQTECGGVCIDLLSDVANCGGCGAACAVGETCSGGACAAVVAAAQTTCEGQGLTDCGGGCVALQTDAVNCGICGNVCPAGATCVGGSCQSPSGCAAGLTNCGALCVDLQTDVFNCGACGNACGVSDQEGVQTICDGGVCGFSSNPAA